MRKPPRKPRSGPRRPSRGAVRPRGRRRPTAGKKARPGGGAPEEVEGSDFEYPEAQMEAYLLGQITLADLEGITKDQQYEMAKVGHAALAGGKLEAAKTVFEGLLALDPFDAYFLSALGSVAQQQGDLEEAEARYSRALEINPFAPFALANRGEVRITQGKLTEGVADLIRAIEEDDGSDPAVQRAKATIGILVDQLEEAGVDSGDLKEVAAVPRDLPPTHPAVFVASELGQEKVAIPKLDKAALEQFAKENEAGFTVRRRGRPMPEPPAEEVTDPNKTVAATPSAMPRKKKKKKKKVPPRKA